MKGLARLGLWMVLAAVGVGLAGCAMTPGGVASSTVPIDGRKYVNLGRVQATDSRVHLLGIIPISGANTTRDAIDACVRSRGGDAMIGVTVDAYAQWWILFTRAVTRVEGDVIRFER